MTEPAHGSSIRPATRSVLSFSISSSQCVAQRSRAAVGGALAWMNVHPTSEGFETRLACALNLQAFGSKLVYHHGSEELCYIASCEAVAANSLAELYIVLATQGTYAASSCIISFQYLAKPGHINH